jgi:hypothetical protein
MAKPIAALIVAIAAAVFSFAKLDATIAADTPVSVLSASDVVLTLPVSPSVDRITSGLQQELERLAAGATDTRLRVSLERMAADPELLVAVATAPVEMFDSGEAAATATAVYDVQLDPDLVTVVVATVELVPAYGATAVSRDHEDGHALINRAVAIRCAKSALATSVNSGHQGNALIANIIWSLSSASDPIHDRYHKLSARAALGNHRLYAQQALDEMADCD